ncbi:hypothetical protein ACP4OV_004229 [Aristida adscensionis]
MPAPRRPFAGGDTPAADTDPDYLYFLQHIRLDGGSYVLELPARGGSPPYVLRYEAPVASSDGECVYDPSPGRLSTNRLAEEVESSAEAQPAWYDSLQGVDEDYRLFLRHTRLVDGRLVFEKGGVVINYDHESPAQSAGSSRTEEEGKPCGEEAVVASSGEGVSAGGEKGVVSEAPAMAATEQYACDWRADPEPVRQMDEEAGGPVGAAADPVVKVEKELGVIWPAHINQRPDSDFKRRLIKVLTKPVVRKEYFKLFDMATTRTPVMKLRQVRNETKFYPTEEMGNSYLDHYPDLADQVMSTGRRHGLALMRGFFFWLQNSAHEDQFKPWVDDSKEPEIIPLVD